MNPMKSNDLRPNLSVRVEPNEMVRYVQDLMAAPRGKKAAPAADDEVARAAQIRWTALNRRCAREHVDHPAAT